MLGSGIFFTPGQLASVAQANWQVYFFWALCGLITLCGALTLAELATLFPRSGSSYYMIRDGFGPFWGFLTIWVEMFVSGPGSVAGVAIIFGAFLVNMVGGNSTLWGILAISFFTIINLLGVRWGGRTQILLTAIKVAALLILVFGAIFLAEPAKVVTAKSQFSLPAFLRLIGLGVAAVLFTYDGWIDVSHVAGEVERPRRNLPTGLAVGVGLIIVLYLLVNFAFLRVMPLQLMKSEPDLVAARVASSSFSAAGGKFLNILMMLSIFGALGGLQMTLPRLFFGAASQLQTQTPNYFFRTLSYVSGRSAVPAGSILFCAITSAIALLTFGSFNRLANFFLVSLQFINILMVAAIYRLRNKSTDAEIYRTPGYPVTPMIFIFVMALLLMSAIYYRPVDTLIGVALTGASYPVYLLLNRRRLHV
jgi:APA family basic amino acid/polyamine antiporter